MENEIKLNGTVLAEDDSAGTEEDPITSLIRAKYIDPDGKIHLAVLQTLLSAVVDDDGKRLDRIIKELQDAVGTGGKPVTEIINTEIDKKVGDLSNLTTKAKDSVVNAVNEINHGLDEKLQYVPVVADVTQNPETYETGYIYSVEGAVSEENGHPYTISWKHITYLVFGDENGKNGYKNILALDNDGNIYNKSQLWDADRWSDWRRIATLKDLKSFTVYNKDTITNDILIGSAFTERSWVGVGHNLENAPALDWFNYLCLDAASTGSDISQILAFEINGSNPHAYFTNDVRGKNWKRFLDSRDFSENISNESILINADFRNPINQRGLNKYDSKDRESYSIDRWLCSWATCEIKNGYIRVEFTNAWNMFEQMIENLEKYMGQTVTLSVKYRDAKNVRLNIRSRSSSVTSVEFVGESFSGNGIVSLTGVVKTIENPTELVVSLQATAEGAYADVEWMKLEMGREATAFVPPNRTEELLKCKRYYQKLGGWWKYMSAGFVKRATKVASFPLIVGTTSMRVTPTLTISNKENIKVIGGNINTDIVDLEGFQHASENYYSISFTLPENLEVERVNEMVLLYFGENVELQFDAEIY